MRIDRPDSPDPSPGSPAAAWVRLRAWFEDLGPTGRMVVVAGLLAAMVAIGFVASSDPTPAWVRLYPDHRFTPEDARQIVQRLVRESIAAQAVGGRVEVPADRQAEAYDIVAKAGLEPLSPRQIKDRPPEFRPLLTPDQIARLDLREQERFVEGNLRLIDPSLSATVQIRREERRGLSRHGGARVTVELRLEDGRAIPPELAERVRNKVKAWLEPDQLTLMDVRGTILFSADDPSLGRRTLIQAREDALRSELVAGLSWIEGVRVTVEVEPGAEPEPHPLAPDPSEAAEQEPIIRPNGPIAAIEPPSPAPEPPTSPSSPGAGKANIIVLVPNLYYQRIARGPTGDADPSADEIQALLARTEATILTVVARTIPAEDLGEVTVDRFFPTPPDRPSPPPTAGATALARLPAWWPAAAGAGMIAVGALFVAAGRGLRHRGAESSSRRPSATPTRRTRLDVGLSEDAGPSERARELIRQDPAAAAGVLRRWIGQGGPHA